MEIQNINLDIKKTQQMIRQNLQMLDELGDKISSEKELSGQQSKYIALADKKSRLTINY